jgi:hypothetical protein
MERPLPPTERIKPEQQSRRVGESTPLGRGPYPARRSPIVIAPAEDAGARSARVPGVMVGNLASDMTACAAPERSDLGGAIICV